MKQLILLFMLIPMISFAQCKKKVEIDKFTGDTIQTGKNYMINRNYIYYGVAFRTWEYNDMDYLKITWTDNKIHSIYKDHQISFLLENKMVIKMPPIDNVVAKYNRVENITLWTTKPVYFISSYDKRYLSKYKATHVRIMTTEGYAEYKISKKGARRLIEAFNCL